MEPCVGIFGKLYLCKAIAGILYTSLLCRLCRSLVAYAFAVDQSSVICRSVPPTGVGLAYVLAWARCSWDTAKDAA